MKWITLYTLYSQARPALMSYGLGNGHLLTRAWCIECNMLESVPGPARGPEVVNTENKDVGDWRAVISDISKHSISRELEGRKSHRKTLLLTSSCGVWGHSPTLLVRCSSSAGMGLWDTCLSVCLSVCLTYQPAKPQHLVSTRTRSK